MGALWITCGRRGRILWPTIYFVDNTWISTTRSQPVLEVIHRSTHLLVRLDEFADLLPRMDDGGVVLLAEGVSEHPAKL